jgi:hypothetical protein
VVLAASFAVSDTFDAIPVSFATTTKTRLAATMEDKFFQASTFISWEVPFEYQILKYIVYSFVPGPQFA